MNTLSITTSILSIVTTVTTIIIVVLQYRLSKYRWRLDLFEKRYQIFNKTINFIQLVDSKRKLNHSELSMFNDEIRNKDFLFGKEVKVYLNKIFENGNKLIQLSKKLESLEISDARNKLCDTETEIYSWFTNQYEESRKIFGKYLSIDKK